MMLQRMYYDLIRLYRSSKASNQLELLSQPRLIAVDFDGCLTNDYVYLNSNGLESVRLTRKDGLGADRLKKMKIRVVIVSSETNQVVQQRAKKMRIDVIQGTTDKLSSLNQFLLELNIPWSQTWFIGNDINDLKVMEKASLSLCPLDSAPEIIATSDVVLPVKGGDGVLNFLARVLEA
jgi:YrbI family 3-deoxy-D-manno-octulosonate 8-phosphate phosphatase